MTYVTAESVSQMTEKTKNVKELIKALHGGGKELSYFMFLFSLTAHFFVTSELSQENEKELQDLSYLHKATHSHTHRQTQECP